MNNQPGRCTRHWMQIQEVLVAMCIGAGLSGAALEMGMRTVRHYRDSAAYVVAAQENVLLRRAWRQFVHESGGPLRTDGEALAGGGARAWVDAAGLHLEQEGAARTVSLPWKATGSITTEGEGDAARYVLTVEWPRRRAGRSDRYATRVVACRTEDAQ